jgi:integrase
MISQSSGPFPMILKAKRTQSTAQATSSCLSAQLIKWLYPWFSRSAVVPAQSRGTRTYDQGVYLHARACVLDPPPIRDGPATANRDIALILVPLDTGIRASELCALKVEDVDLKLGKAEIRHGALGGARGGKGRTVYLGRPAGGHCGATSQYGRIGRMQKLRS